MNIYFLVMVNMHEKLPFIESNLEPSVKPSKQYTQREIKRILHKISKLSEIEHKGIYKIISQHDISYTHNKNGIFISMSSIPHHVIEEIEHFVNFCVLNNIELDAHEKKLNECKFSQFYKITWGKQKGDPPISDSEDKHNDGESEKSEMGSFLDYGSSSSFIKDKRGRERERDRDESDIAFNNLGESRESEKKDYDNDNMNANAQQTHTNEGSRVNEYGGAKRSKNDWSNLLNEKCSGQSYHLINKFANHLEDNIDNLQKKKVNTHYINAKKKFSRKINAEKKYEQDIYNILTFDE